MGVRTFRKIGPALVIDSMVTMFNSIKKYGPELATFYGRSDDYKTYTFHLRDDVLWHEPAVDNASGQYDWLLNGESCREGHFINGRCRVTAHDVVFMIDMMMNNQVAGAAPIRSYFQDLESYSAPDDFTLVLKFKQKKYKCRYWNTYLQ